MTDLDREIDRLYSVTPDAFVRARDELVRRLRASGDPAERLVKSLRRPTLAAWALNQLARRHPEAIEEVVRAGEELRRTQREAVSGGDPTRLREAAGRRRRAVRGAADLAATIGEPRPSLGVLEAVRATLEAASVDEEAGRVLRQGRLERELEVPSGFEVVGEERRGRLGRAVREGSGGHRADLRAARDAARAEAGDLERAAARARKESAQAERLAVTARREAERLGGEAQRAKTRAREAEKAARASRKDAAELDHRVERARRRLAELETRLRARARR